MRERINVRIFRILALPILAGLIAATLSASGCLHEPKKAELKTISIAFQKWPGYGLFYLAEEKGFCRDSGIRLMFVDEELDSARRDALKEGMLDCEAGTLDLLVNKRAAQVPVVAIMELDRSSGSDGIVAVKDIVRLEDLVGRRVALAKDDVGETFLSYLLDRRGIKMKDLDIVSVRPDEAAETFIDGDADAVATWEPQLSKALEREGSHLVTSTREEPGIVVDTLNVRESLIRDEPRAVKALMRSWFKALSYYKEHPEESSGIIGGRYGMSPEEYRKAVTGLKWTELNDEPEALIAEWKKIFDSIAGIKFSNGKISVKPGADSAIYPTMIKELYEDSQ